jgi:hypothetical protein
MDWTIALLFRPDVSRVDVVPAKDDAPAAAATRQSAALHR